MPNHVEAVGWIAAVGDPLATLFYLLSFYFYIFYAQFPISPPSSPERDYGRAGNVKFQISNRKYLISLGFFVLALLTKEISITLPFVILAYEVIIRKNLNLSREAGSRFAGKSLILNLSPYFIILTTYLAYRYWAIGLLFGYYGRTSLAGVLHIKEYLVTLINISASMVSVGGLRILLGHLVSHYWYFVVAILVFLFSCLYVYMKNHQRELIFLTFFWIINVALILPLSLGIINDEGQRYGYLPSIAVAVLIVWIIMAVMNYSEKLVRVVIILTVCYLVLFQQMLVNQWGISSMFSNRIYHQLSTFDFQTPKKTYIVGLPDSYLNAQLYRNGIIQSLELQNIKFDPSKVERVPVYVHLESLNRDSKLYGQMSVEKDGFLWTTKDNQYIVTGNATESYPDYHFELWGYNYGNATANHVRMYFDGSAWKEGGVQVIYFDEGMLKAFSF